MSNPMTPPFAVSSDDQTLIFQANATQPVVDGGAMDTANVVFLATSPDVNTRKLAQEVLAYRWANCQANP